MSLADGLNAGFNMALNLAKFQSDEEERKKNAAYIDSRIAYTNSLEEKNRQTIDSLIAAERKTEILKIRGWIGLSNCKSRSYF